MERFILATVYKQGSSLVVSIPRAICKALNIERGDQLEVRVARGGLVVLKRVPELKKLPTIKF